MSEPACPSLPQPGQDRTLHDAIDEFRRVLSANVALAGAEDHLDRSEQFQAIEATARRLGSLFRLMVDDLGFEKLRHNFGIGYEDSYAFVRDDAAVFDLRPANVFATATGLLVAIDSIPVRLTPETRAMFAR